MFVGRSGYNLLDNRNRCTLVCGAIGDCQNLKECQKLFRANTHPMTNAQKEDQDMQDSFSGGTKPDDFKDFGMWKARALKAERQLADLRRDMRDIIKTAEAADRHLKSWSFDPS